MSEETINIEDTGLPTEGITIEEGASCVVYVSKDDDNDDDYQFRKAAYETILNSVSGANTEAEIKEDIRKSFEGSNQSQEDLGECTSVLEYMSTEFPIQPTPYNPSVMLKLKEMSPIHAKCIKVKVRDSVGRNYKITSKYTIRKDLTANVGSDDGLTISEEEFQKEVKKIKFFIENCNSNEELSEIAYKVGLDKEGTGWGGFEVIRNASGKIARLLHVPGERLRVLKGFKGFVEINPATGLMHGHTYFQPFGQKVGKWVQDPFDLRPSKKVFKPYNPEEDGELEIGGQAGLEFNLMDKKTGLPMKGRVSSNFKNAANELLFITNTDNSTIYYGSTDVIPAIGAIIVNSKIQDFYHQFFDHNCIPRYVVIIRNAKVEDSFMKTITEYFENKIKGSAHKTMILALGGSGGSRSEIEFKALNEGLKDSNFDTLEKSNDQKIMVAHGIPPAVLGINDSASLGSGKGMSQADLYKNRVVLPLQNYWASKLNKLFRLGLGCKYAKIEFDPMDIKDSLEIAQALNYLLTLGVLTINEARRRLGLDGSIPGGDIAFVRLREKSLVKVEDLPKLTAALEDLDMNEEVKEDIIVE